MDRRQGSSLTSDGQGKGYGKHLSSQDESKCLQKALSSMGARLAKVEKQRQEKGKEHHRFPYTSFVLLDRIRDLVATSCGFEDSSWMHMLYKMEKEPDRDWAKYAQESLAEISDDEIPLEIPLEELRYILTDLHDPPDIDRIPTLVRWRNDFCTAKNTKIKENANTEDAKNARNARNAKNAKNSRCIYVQAATFTLRYYSMYEGDTTIN